MIVLSCSCQHDKLNVHFRLFRCLSCFRWRRLVGLFVTQREEEKNGSIFYDSDVII